MIIPTRFSKVARNFVAAAAAFSLCLLIFTETFGQSLESLRDRVYKNQKKNSQTDKNVKANSLTKKTAPAKKKLPAPVKSSAGTAKRTLPKSALFVTFVAKEPSVEVWLNDKLIGYTDNRFQLSKKLAQGEYSLMAKNKRQIFLPTRRINVSPAQTSFKLFIETAETPKPPPPAMEKKQPPKEEKSELEEALEISNKVKKILEDYVNPETTDSITPEDWQLVFQAAQLGQLQGYTAVQIEAQRWFASGQIELSQKQFANALTAFNKAQEFMPKSPLPFYALGDTYLANNQLNDAVKLYQRALQLDPKFAAAYKKFGDTQRLLHKDKEAIAAYKNAVSFGYKTPETRYWMGTLMLENKQIEPALEILEEVAKEMPRAEVFISIGSGYEKLKRDVSAIEYYLKAVEIDPNSAVAYYKLANVYLNQRENDKAKNALEKAIALDPNGKHLNRLEAQKKLREVSSKLNK